MSKTDAGHPTESRLLYDLLIRASALGARLFRNQVGQYRLARPDCPRCQQTGRILRSGLCVGSSDTVGWVPVTIRPEHVGRTLAVFVAIETKSLRGVLSDEQRQFLAVAESHGAVTCVARSVADAETALAPYL